MYKYLLITKIWLITWLILNVFKYKSCRLATAKRSVIFCSDSEYLENDDIPIYDFCHYVKINGLVYRWLLYENEDDLFNH